MNEPTLFGALVLGKHGVYVRTNTGSNYPWHCRDTKMFYRWDEWERVMIGDKVILDNRRHNE